MSGTSEDATGRVSCIIPTHDRPELLADAVGSVQAQTHDDVEIIVVHDESDYKTEAVLQNIQSEDERLVALSTEKRTPWEARNTGIEEATGQYIAFLDDDDRWHPEKLKRQLPYADEYSLVSCSCWFIRTDETVEKNVEFSGMAEKTLEDVFRSIRNLYPSGTLARTECVRSIGGFDERFLEWDFYIRMVAEHGPAAVLAEPLVYFNRDDIDRVSDEPHCQNLLNVYEHHKEKVSRRSRRYRMGNIYLNCYDEQRETMHRLQSLAKVAYYNPGLLVPRVKQRLIGVLATLGLKRPVKRLIGR